MPYVMNSDGEQIDFDWPPMTEEEFRLLIEFANAESYERATASLHVQTQREAAKVALLVSRYRRYLV